MDSDGVRSEKRGRKRMGDQSDGLDRWNLVGRIVRKEFEGIGVFSGKIVKYMRGGLYKVKYEDGDAEDLEYDEIREILVDEVVGSGDNDAELGPGKGKIDYSVSRMSREGSDRVGESSAVSKLNSDCDAGSDADSSSVSCKSETPPLRPLPLPPSSGNIDVPEESVSFLFSVYNFLRSFSHQLFLSPFSLDDFVGSLNCMCPNTLLDAVHVSLLRALRRHLEAVSNDGSNSELGSKCLRSLDWSLLDTLTWTVYVVEYLLIMDYTKGKDWKEFHDHVLNREYYSLPVPIKLRILQILSDDLLEFAELRTEINMRECAEVGMDSDEHATPNPESAPKRVHPRYSKTSACKDPENMENIVEPCESKPSGNHSFADSSKSMGPDANASDVDDDGNSDECKLCGMDGTLLCCDGCPFVYHSRCIGMTKASIPVGSWFCPECVVNKIGSVCSRIGKGLRGAEVFGIDPYERVFMGTCNYILVLDTSINTEPIYRQYSQSDVLELLRMLLSSAHHASLYSQICKGILQYCEISEDAILLHSGGTKPETKQLDGNEGKEHDVNPLDGKEDAMCATFSVKENSIPLNIVEQENCTSNASESNVENGAAPSCRQNDYIEAGVKDPIVDLCKGGFLSQQKDDVHCGAECAQRTALQLCPLANTKFDGKLGMESTVSAGSQILLTGPSDLNHQSSGERSIVLEFATCASRDADSTGREDADSMVLCTKNGILNTSLENRRDYCSDRSKGDMIDCRSYMGTSFKPQGYINQYILGDVAASAAANLAVLASENSKVSEAQSSSNPRKATSGDIALQIKAFSGSALHFQWPSSEKKLMEVPRERCGWCIACAYAGTYKRGCLLNSAASNALKGDPRVIGGVRLIKNGEGSLPAIAAYIVNMEESLRGLIVGPLLTVSYRRHWRKQLEQASACKSLKHLLLELEENIHMLALSGGWVKPMDDLSIKLSTAQVGTSIGGSTQKRGTSTRRNRKQSATSEIMDDASLKCFHWWRGGELSKLVFQTGILPSSIVIKTARRGGYKKISGIHYVEGSDIPRRSRRFSWRAAVEMSKNASQLALQVRCLDAHVRWSDIVRPESQDGKGLDIETSSFRNAFICDKKIVERKIRYALAFGNQKHLPLRIKKNIIEVEQSQDGMDKFWFSENHIPLYLIKEYEVNAETKVPLPLVKKASHYLSKTPRRQLKTWSDIFSYLMHRDDTSSCVLCQQDVLLRNAVKCNACQGYCHKDCTVPSTAESNDELEFVRVCKQCYLPLATIPDQNFGNRPKVQLSLQEQHQIASSSAKSTQRNHYHIGPRSFGNVEVPLETKPTKINKGIVRNVRAASSAASSTYGLIWKKKKNNTSELSTDFRLKNILLRGNVGMDPLMRPICSLCNEHYNSNLMYICCENCANWYHADAVELKEDKIFELEGFKCCKCRRKSSPMCPYMSEEKKLRMKNTKKLCGKERNQNSIMCAVSGNIIGKPELAEPTTPVFYAQTEYVATEEDDPLLFSLENVEPITEQMPEIRPEWNGAPVLYHNPQKLPVRRHGKHEMDCDGFAAVPAHEDAEYHGTDLANAKEEALSPHAEWDFPIGGELADFQGGSTESMVFEPQTYFSFTELLATGDDRMDELFDAPMNVPGNWGNASGHDASGHDDMGTVGQVMPSYNSFETYEMGMVNSLQELTAADSVPCEMCGHIQPAPDLSCEICRLQIHSHCSPWEEPSSCDYRWRCGRCRDWR